MEKRYIGEIANVIDEINRITGMEHRFIGNDQAINEMAWEKLIEVSQTED